MHNLILALSALAMLTAGVGIRMYFVRLTEMRNKKILPQSLASSIQGAKKLQDTRASDNFRNLFELPVLFYTLCLLALTLQHIPNWLPPAAWLFVGLRICHSIIHCSYNTVVHRFLVFIAGFILLGIMWISFTMSYIMHTG